MSTDPGHGDPGPSEITPPAGRSEERRRIRYRRLTIVLVVVLVVVAAGLAAAGATRGPRLSSAEVNPHAVSSRAGQRLVLTADQPLSPVRPSQVDISPSATTEVSVDGSALTIRFPGILDYGTTYTVDVAAVGEFTGVSGRFEYEFSTPDVDVYALLRGGATGTDQILRSSLAGSRSNEVVYEAPRIQEYLRLDDLLAVVTLDGDDHPTLLLTSMTDEFESAIYVDDPRAIRDLHAADSGDLFGYVVDSGRDPAGSSPAESSPPESSPSALFIYDTTDSSGVPIEVTGPGGGPLSVMAWTFVPGTTSLVAQGDDQQLYLIDPLADDALTDEVATPLGRHRELEGFIPGSRQLVVADPQGSSIVDLESGLTTDLKLPDPTTDPTRYPGKQVLLTPRDYVGLSTAVIPGSNDYQVNSALDLTDATGSRELYTTPSDDSWIRDYCLSPNGEYLAVEVVPKNSPPDDYPIVTGYTGTTISFVRISDGSSSRSVNGFLPDWCRSEP